MVDPPEITGASSASGPSSWTTSWCTPAAGPSLGARTPGAGVFVPVPSTAELTDVDVADGQDDGHDSPRPGATSYRSRSGWLVDLRVDS